MPDSLPRLGFGTYQNTDHDQCAESVRTAIDLGYRHIDTAQGYDNEAAVGDGIDAAAVDRDDIFLATKVDTGNLAYEDVLESTQGSLDRLGVDVIDLLYIHWPIDTYDAPETLRAMQELYDDGTIRHIGVSNFEPRHLEEAREILDAPIFANQVEMHPQLHQEELLADAQAHEYWLVAYSPLGKTQVFDHPTVQAVAEDEGIAPSQVCLSWLLGKDNVAAIPKATGEAHIRENYKASNVSLSPEATAAIEDIDETMRLVDFETAPWNQ